MAQRACTCWAQAAAGPFGRPPSLKRACCKFAGKNSQISICLASSASSVMSDMVAKCGPFFRACAQVVFSSPASLLFSSLGRSSLQDRPTRAAPCLDHKITNVWEPTIASVPLTSIPGLELLAGKDRSCLAPPHSGAIEERAAAFWQHTDVPEEMAGIRQAN